MMSYKQGAVVLVPIPFTDQTSSKKRPAIVISANWYNRLRADVILAPITSTVRKPIDREEVLIQGSDFRRAGLYKESVVKCGSIIVVRQKLILRQLGAVPIGLIKQIHKKVTDVLSGASD